MRKRAILWLFLASIILAIIGAVIFAIGAVSATGHCSQAQLHNGTCTINPTGAQSAAIAIGVILWILAAVLDLVACVMALIRSAMMRSWGWFIFILLIHGLGTLIYAIAGPPDQPSMPTYQQPTYPSGYPPNYPPGQNPPAVG